MDTPHTTPQHERVAIAPEQLLGVQHRAARVWTAVHNMHLVQTNVYPEAITPQAAPIVTVVEPVPAEVNDFPINQLEAERLAVQAALQQAA